MSVTCPIADILDRRIRGNKDGGFSLPQLEARLFPIARTTNHPSTCRYDSLPAAIWGIPEPTYALDKVKLPAHITIPALRDSNPQRRPDASTAWFLLSLGGALLALPIRPLRFCGRNASGLGGSSQCILYRKRIKRQFAIVSNARSFSSRR
jgi:hypothetical protein